MLAPGLVAPGLVDLPMPALVAPRPASWPASPPLSTPPAQQSFEQGRGAHLPDGFRAGYAAYLRSASVRKIASVVLIGLTGLAALMAAGGLIGYRQARAGLAVRAAGAARFL